MPARLVPVLDLRGGLAVRGVAGDRAHYRPLRSRWHPEPDPVPLARHVRDRFGPAELYLADLDAIGGFPPNLGIFRTLADDGFRLWVDAGLHDASDVSSLLDARVEVVVAGLETIRGPGPLAEVLAAAGPDRVVFSLDLREGRPILPQGSEWADRDPASLVAAALQVGCRRILLLDLARVGLGRGVGATDLLRTLHVSHPDLELSIGGGVSDRADLDELGRLGASAVLVCSALHDGRFPA